MKIIYYFVMCSLLLTACQQRKELQTNMTEQRIVEKAKQIHENVITIDTHCDINVANFTADNNYTSNLSSQVTLPKMEAGGLDCAWFIVYTGQDELTTEGYAAAYDNAISKFDAIHNLCEVFAPDQIELALNSDDVRRIHKSGKKIAMIGVENAYPIGLDLKRIKEFKDRGARYMSLSHNGHSQFCDSNTGEENNEWLYNGLSDLGKQAVVEMNKQGIMIDVSHPAKSSIADMLEISKAPLIASHSSARALCNHSRNLDDGQLKAIADKGGVIQTVAFDAYVNTEKSKELDEVKERLTKELLNEWGVKWTTREERKDWTKEQNDAYWNQLQKAKPFVEKKIITMENPPTGVTVSDFVDHIVYMVDLIGIDHVGISSDFDGGGGISGWDDASETLNVTIELVRRGYSEAQIKQLWGDNLLRVLDEVQAISENWEK